MTATCNVKLPELANLKEMIATPVRAFLIGSLLFTLSFFQYDKLSIFLLYRYQNGILHKTKHL